MKFNPKDAPTEFLRSYGEFLSCIQNQEEQKAEKLLNKLIVLEEVTGKERVLLMLGDELKRRVISFNEVLEEYSEQVNAALP